jgi:arabinogalactan oligomer/maltooligosaccharide transport system substrate-binding protein
MTMKHWSVQMILVLISVVFSACTSAGNQTPGAIAEPPAAPVTITIWHQWSGESLTAIQEIFYQYMNEHSNVSIVLDAPQDLQSALQLAIPAGEGPDIISWANDAIGRYANSGYIIDLGGLGVTQDFLKASYEPAAVNGVVWQDRIWALPVSQEASAIIYNKAMVSTTDFPSAPMDFAGLLVKARQYAEANPGKYLICNQGFGAADAYNEAPVYFGFGVPGYVDDTGKAYLNTPEAIAAGSWIQEFRAYAAKDTSYDICNSGIADGTFASWWTDPQAIANFDKAGIDYGILPMGKPFVGVMTMMITKNAVDRGNAATALDLVQYFTNQANEIQLTLANQIIPANTAALADPQIQALAKIKGFGTAAQLGVAMATTPYADAQWAPVGDATEAIWNGLQTPEQALSAAQTAIEAAIEGMK